MALEYPREDIKELKELMDNKIEDASKYKCPFCKDTKKHFEECAGTKEMRGEEDDGLDELKLDQEHQEKEYISQLRLHIDLYKKVVNRLDNRQQELLLSISDGNMFHYKDEVNEYNSISSMKEDIMKKYTETCKLICINFMK